MTQVTENIEFTDQAATKVKKLIVEEKNPMLKLRVYVSGGGCSGFQYGFEFDERHRYVETAKTSSRLCTY